MSSEDRAVVCLRAVRVAHGAGPGGRAPACSFEVRIPATRVVLTLLGIVSISIGWATVWTKHFKESVRVRNTFHFVGSV